MVPMGPVPIRGVVPSAGYAQAVMQKLAGHNQTTLQWTDTVQRGKPFRDILDKPVRVTEVRGSRGVTLVGSKICLKHGKTHSFGSIAAGHSFKRVGARRARKRDHYHAGWRFSENGMGKNLKTGYRN